MRYGLIPSVILVGTALLLQGQATAPADGARDKLMARLREKMQSENWPMPDGEWQVLGPRTAAVLDVQEDICAGRGINSEGELAAAPTGSSELQKALANLAAAEDKPDSERRAAREAYRVACQQAQTRLSQAQRSLIQVLTSRQEGTLMRMGILLVAYDGPRLNLNEEQQKTFLAKLRKQLAVGTDAEWQVIEPQLVKVLAAQRQLQAGHDADPRVDGPELAKDPDNPLAAAAVELVRQLPRSMPQEELQAAIKKYREARAEAEEKLVTAQQNLSKVLTFYQEGVLIRAGLLEAIDWRK